ncbi:hypothetical protein ACNKHW_13155 [Shigella flexneri]
MVFLDFSVDNLTLMALTIATGSWWFTRCGGGEYRPLCRKRRKTVDRYAKGRR